MSRKSETDSVARLLPFLSGSGVDRLELDTSRTALPTPTPEPETDADADASGGRVRIREDDRTLFDAEGVLLSEVSGGVTSCRTADRDRASSESLSRSRNAREVEVVDASLAFCARVAMTDLKGTTVDDRLLAVLSGDVELDITEPPRLLPLVIPRPRGSASGSGVGRPMSSTGEEMSE